MLFRCIIKSTELWSKDPLSWFECRNAPMRVRAELYARGWKTYGHTYAAPAEAEAEVPL
jgi:hypothetical protein